MSQLSLDADKLLKESPFTTPPPSQPQDGVNGPSESAGDGALPTSPPDVAPGNKNGPAVPVPLRKFRPVSMGARIQVSEEQPAADQSGDLSPAASRSQKASQSRPNSSALETLGGELTNGSLELPAPGARSLAKRDSDCGSISTSGSTDFGTSLSADLSVNKESGCLSIKVTTSLVHGLGAGVLHKCCCSVLGCESVQWLPCILSGS